MITIADFQPPPKAPYNFGFTKESVSSGLQTLAKQIEEKTILMERIVINEEVSNENFTRKTLTLTFCERVTP